MTHDYICYDDMVISHSSLPMTILTLNCFGAPLVAPRAIQRMRRIARHITLLNPDIVCLQEIFLPWHKRLFVNALARWPHRFVPWNGVLNTGAGLCVFSKFPMRERAFHNFSETGQWSNFTVTDKIFEKGWGEISFARPRPFRLLNTHLTCNYDGNYHPLHRISRIQRVQLRDMATAVRKAPRKIPVFVAGDLNIPPSSSLLKEFLATTGSDDLTPGDAPSIVGNHYRFSTFLGRTVSRHKADYIIGRNIPPEITSWRYVLNGGKLSDHLGILLEVNW